MANKAQKQRMTEPFQIMDDFDRIAMLPAQRWDHNLYFYNFIKRQISNLSGTALDVGSGKGALCGLLAEKFSHVTGIDISPKMIEIAQIAKSQDNIHFLIGDYLQSDFGSNFFDFIVSVATVHHMDFKDFLIKARNELKENGNLIIIDLYHTNLRKDVARSLLSKVLDNLYNVLYNGRLTKPTIEKAYWDEHGENDLYLDFDEVVDISETILGDPVVSKELFWRYSLVWSKT